MKIQTAFCAKDTDERPDLLNFARLIQDLEKIKKISHNLSFYAFGEFSCEAEMMEKVYEIADRLMAEAISDGIELED